MSEPIELPMHFHKPDIQASEYSIDELEDEAAHEADTTELSVVACCEACANTNATITAIAEKVNSAIDEYGPQIMPILDAFANGPIGKMMKGFGR